jgi:sarcosine oxidase subunit alpha
MIAVRNRVGVFDASPLGKVEVTGPDARVFLDRMVVSDLSTLAPGRARYTLMLEEDGVIFDDGVLGCLADDHFLAGPSSGNAEAVVEWLERWRQTEWPDLRVALTDVTSAWACIALAGPGARTVLEAMQPDFDVGAAAFPHMGVRQGRVCGVAARVARVSFTGELQFELSVPARFGDALFRHALECGAGHGAVPVGIEAWLRLRTEKGYLHVGTDTNGRTTPADVGMQRLVARKAADFVGKRSLSLAFPAGTGREQLVGLRGLDGPLEAGGRVLGNDAASPPCVTVGYVTSACRSPSLSAWIGLALIEDGAARHGERVRVHCTGGVRTAQIVAPVFLDLEGRRLDP